MSAFFQRTVLLPNSVIVSKKTPKTNLIASAAWDPGPREHFILRVFWLEDFQVNSIKNTRTTIPLTKHMSSKLQNSLPFSFCIPGGCKVRGKNKLNQEYGEGECLETVVKLFYLAGDCQFSWLESYAFVYQHSCAAVITLLTFPGSVLRRLPNSFEI